MRKPMLVAGAAAALLFANYLAFVQPTRAGWGAPFACGAGTKTQEIHWDDGIATPGEVGPAITGVLASTAPVDGSESEWTIEELQNAKPLLVYYYMDGETDAQSEDYKFARRFEMGALQDKVIERLNEKWRAKKVGLDMEADRTQAKNQSRIEFWSYTGVKMGEISLKQQNLLNTGPLFAKLKGYEAKHASMLDAEIKRLQKIEKEQQDADGDETASK